MLEQIITSLKNSSITIVAPNFISANSSKYNVVNEGFNACDLKGNPIEIKINGEKHWVFGVDSHTTCTNLIAALLFYQDLERKRCHIDNGMSNTYNLSNKLGRSINMSNRNANHKSSTTNQTKEENMLFKNPHEYVIVKQLRYANFEEYLDGSTRLLDVIPNPATETQKQCELQLRHLSPRIYNLKQNHVLSMLSMSTDKDSGMGSPVGSSRSERYRRRRGKQKAAIFSLPVMTRGHSAPPKRTHQQKHQLTHCNLNPNERLMNIILAQDQTINRQIYLLNQKKEQILMIENEKHRVRELKMGKDYMLDAYLNESLNTQDCDEQRKGLPILHGDNPNAVQISTGDLNRLETKNSWAVESNLPKDVDIYWLEKVYGLNILLQREEEHLLKLHAKVRKHQMKCAYHTKDDVLQQIDGLDTQLAKQVVDIYRVGRQLLTANEQLKAKLGVLESLGHELETIPFASIENEKNVSAPLKDLTFVKIKDVMGYPESMVRPYIRDLQEKDTTNENNIKYVKTRSEKSTNVLRYADAKLLSKQMFFAAENPESENHKEPQPITSCQLGLKTNDMIITLVDSNSDLQEYGTLV